MVEGVPIIDIAVGTGHEEHAGEVGEEDGDFETVGFGVEGLEEVGVDLLGCEDGVFLFRFGVEFEDAFLSTLFCDD
jgi:hypothetical protein